MAPPRGIRWWYTWPHHSWLEKLTFAMGQPGATRANVDVITL
jgi:hypothetical protein